MLEITIFLAAAVVAVPLFRLLGLGAVLGYLAAGVLIGPSALGLITDVDSILQLSKIGVVLLLFLVGLELAPRRLWVMRRSIFGLGLFGVTACALPFALLAWGVFGLSWQAALIVGPGLAFSSTAFAMQALAERNELPTAHGRGAFAMLLFKYLALLPLLAAIPLLAGGEPGLRPAGLVLAALQTAGVLVVTVVGGHFLLRPVFRTVARIGERETFTATALLVVLGVSLLVEWAGLPMALGAFLAGVLLADSEYRHEIHVSIEPFKGLLLGLFFIAVGMSADLGLLAETPGLVLGLSTAVLLAKLLVIYAVARATGMADHSARALAAVMPQGGELAFVLFSTAAVYGVLAAPTADVLVAVVTLTMAATPLTILGNRLLLDRWLEAAPPEARPYDRVDDAEAPRVLICGFGRFGQTVGRILHSAHIPFTALDANPVQVDFIRRYGHRIYYGDPARVELLRAAGAEHAEAIVIALDDVEASMRTAEHIRRHFPQVPVYARALNRQHVWRLMDLECQVIARETLAGSLDMGESLLQRFGWATGEAAEAMAHFRRHDEEELHKHYAIHQEQGSRSPSDKEIADELEGLFAADEADSIDPEHEHDPAYQGRVR